jgi:hypothetical protein
MFEDGLGLEVDVLGREGDDDSSHGDLPLSPCTSVEEEVFF